MASPSSSRPSNSTFGGNNHGPGWFQSDGRNPFKQEANQGSLSFAEASPWIFHNHAFLPRNAFQSSGLSDNGSLTSNSTCQAHSTGVSPPLFSFKDASPSFMDTTNKCEPKAPLCHTSPLGGGSLMLEASQSGAANATFGPANCSTFSTARAPSVASANSQKAPGRSSAPFFSFGKSPSIAATSKEDCLRRPSQQPPFTFSSTPRPEPQSLSRNPLAQGANGTSDLSWGQNESLSSRGSLPIRSAPSSPFAPASPREYSFWRPSAPTMRIGDRTQEFLNFSCTAPNPTIPISAEQNVVGPVLTSPVLVSGPSSGSARSQPS